MKLHILHCGEVCVDPALPFANEASHPLSFTGLFRSWKKRLWLPVSAYLLEHPKGLVLFDTGWHRDMSPQGVYDKRAQIKHLGFIHYFLNQGKIAQGAAIHEQLESRGIKVSDIDYVVLSHLHSDHASGLKHLKGAKKILASKEELEDARRKPHRYVPSMWEGMEISPFYFEDSGLGPVGRSFDLFNDKSVQLINIPGHTSGLCAARIGSGAEFVLLFFDGGYAKKSWLEMIAPGTALDKKQAYKSLEWIAKTSKEANCIESLATHDPDVKPHSIEVA